MLGYTVVDPSTVLATHISEVLKAHLHYLVGRQDVQILLDQISEKNPKVVEELIPNLLSLGGVQKVLQNLLKERVSIRDLLSILETLADYAPSTKNTDILTEYVRQRLGRTITKPYLTEDGTLHLLNLDPQVEDILGNALQHTERESFLSIEPNLAQSVIQSIQRQLDKFVTSQSQPVLLCSPAVRIHLRKLLEKFIPNLSILSHAEIDPQIKIKSLGAVST
jgi:flagellar biosynthesis protein FlhA